MSTVKNQSEPTVDGEGLRKQLLCRRYLLKDADGQVCETSDGMLWRVAQSVAAAEVQHGADETRVSRVADVFYDLMASGDFLPNSPTLMNAGREKGMLSACFVLPVPDSIEGIFEAIKQTAQVQKMGGGTGFSFDLLRPTGDLVASSGGTTSGPLSFMGVFAAATGAIQQGAFRRGANMGMMSVHHPDILRFITAKSKPSVLENFNLSVKLTDEFMEALNDRPNEPHIVTNPRTGEHYLIPHDIDLASYTLEDLAPLGYVGFPCFTTGQLWWMIVRGAHATGEPGICFIDEVNRHNPTPELGRIEATNPCGEQPLLPNEACNLGSLNLARFVAPDGKDLGWRRLGKTIRWAVRFLDDVIDVNHYPTDQIRDMTLANRKIGLGVMGFADMLILLGIRYDSQEAEALAGRLSDFLSQTAHAASERLAAARGSFPNWAKSIWAEGSGRAMRNASCTTIAPTGSISLIASCSSGIESIYSLAMKRRALDGQEFFELNPLFERLGREQGWLTDAVREAVIRGEPLHDIPGVPPRVADLFVTAHQVSPEWHVRIQAAWQEHIDNAISKTVNLPANATLDDVDAVFRLAHRLGCKGITVYRNGSRQGQTLTAPSKPQTEIRSKGMSPRPRGCVTTGRTWKAKMGCGTLFTTVNNDEHGICEVFANLGKAGGCPSQSEATCRAVSVALRSGIDPAVIIEQLKGIRCMSTCLARKDNGEISVLSCPDAIARAIEEALREEPKEILSVAETSTGRPCPHCGQPMRRESGCSVCDQCQYNSCG